MNNRTKILIISEKNKEDKKTPALKQGLEKI